MNKGLMLIALIALSTIILQAGELKDVASCTRYCAKQSGILQNYDIFITNDITKAQTVWRNVLNDMIGEIQKIPNQGTIFAKTINLFKDLVYLSNQTLDIASAVYKPQMGRTYVLKGTMDAVINLRNKAQKLAAQLLKDSQKKPGVGQKIKNLFTKVSAQNEATLLAMNKALLTFADATCDVLSRKVNQVKKDWEQENI
jgi:hypothetical protein